MTEASRPHTLCSARNLHIDTSKFAPARCPRFRPNYLCLGPTYHRYAPGAFGVACSLPGLDLERFPRDHLRDIVAGMQAFDAEGFPHVRFCNSPPPPPAFSFGSGCSLPGLGPERVPGDHLWGWG